MAFVFFCVSSLVSSCIPSHPCHVHWEKGLACVCMCVGVFACVFLEDLRSLSSAAPLPDKREHMTTCLSSNPLQKAMRTGRTWHTLAFGFALHLWLFFFVGRYLATCPPVNHCLSRSSPFFCSGPTDLLNKGAQTNSFMHVRVARDPRCCVTPRSLDITMQKNQEQCSGTSYQLWCSNRKLVFCWLNQELLCQLSLWKSCSICRVITINVGFLSVVVVEVDHSKTFLRGLKHVESKDVSGTLMSLLS